MAQRRAVSQRMANPEGDDGRAQTLFLDSHGSGGGGGFGKYGGHNLYEAPQAGAPILFGPHFEHFEHEAAALEKITPEARVSSAAQIAARLAEWLGDEDSRRRVVALQRRTLPDAAAVTRCYLHELSPYLVAVHE